jgi:hypothetical protein
VCTLAICTIDPRRSLCPHLAGTKLGEEKGSGEVHIERALPFFEIHLQERLHVVDARVVDESVDPPEAFRRACNQRIKLLGPAHVGRNDLDFASRGANAFSNGLELWL